MDTLPVLEAKPLKNILPQEFLLITNVLLKTKPLEKLLLGMKILIREGSAAKNFEALINLMHKHYKNMMFCSDDKHPNDLVVSHINQLVKRALNKGVPLMHVLKQHVLIP